MAIKNDRQNRTDIKEIILLSETTTKANFH